MKKERYDAGGCHLEDSAMEQVLKLAGEQGVVFRLVYNGNRYNLQVLKLHNFKDIEIDTGFSIPLSREKVLDVLSRFIKRVDILA